MEVVHRFARTCAKQTVLELTGVVQSMADISMRALPTECLDFGLRPVE